jgi:hypothetical protein
MAQKSYAQEKIMAHIEQVMDFFSGEFRADSTEYPVGWVLAPIVAYAPETSLQLGIGAQFVFKPFGAIETVRPSTLEIAARYTLNNQLILSPEYRIFFKEEKYILQGEMTFEKFPQFFYGIGNNTPEENEELYDYSSFVADQMLYRQLFNKMYAGLGYRFAYRYNFDFEEDGWLENNPISGKTGGRSGGLKLGLLYDNRNNVLNSTAGTYAELSHTLHRKFAGSEFDYTLTILDARTYFSPFRTEVMYWPCNFTDILPMATPLLPIWLHWGEAASCGVIMKEGTWTTTCWPHRQNTGCLSGVE